MPALGPLRAAVAAPLLPCRTALAIRCHFFAACHSRRRGSGCRVGHLSLPSPSWRPRAAQHSAAQRWA
eukprot:835191-Alexandrium_andersonii.AAC.1